eukprot:m.203250 g.203250  ORF g.203250 m.203250 type:complete len:119 (-) comp25265_c0_seq3:114-470(-)
MATSYAWSYKPDERPTAENPYGGKRSAASLNQSDDEGEDDGWGGGGSGASAREATSANPHAPKRIRTNPAARVYVGGLPTDADDHDIGTFFGCFGKVLEIKIIKVGGCEKKRKKRRNT